MWCRYRQSRSYNDLVEYRAAQNKAVKEYRKAKNSLNKTWLKTLNITPNRYMLM